MKLGSIPSKFYGRIIIKMNWRKFVRLILLMAFTKIKLWLCIHGLDNKCDVMDARLKDVLMNNEEWSNRWDGMVWCVLHGNMIWW